MSNTVLKLQRYINSYDGNDVVEDGSMGPKTRATVDQLKLPLWVKTALKEVGTKEVVGSQHNKRVLEYHTTTAGRYSNDEVAWCGSFVNWVMLHSGIYDTVDYPERAKAWLDFGYSTDYPMLGSVAIKSRQGGGHVCIVIGTDGKDGLYCVGGNQNNEVSIQLYQRSVFEDFRLPKGFAEYNLSIYTLGNSGKIKEA